MISALQRKILHETLIRLFADPLKMLGTKSVDGIYPSVRSPTIQKDSLRPPGFQNNLKPKSFFLQPCSQKVSWAMSRKSHLGLQGLADSAKGRHPSHILIVIRPCFFWEEI